MIFTINKSQIRNPIISFNPIKVVNYLVICKKTTEIFSHYTTVLKNIALFSSIGIVWVKNINISLSIFCPISRRLAEALHLFSHRKVSITLPTKLGNWRFNSPTRWTLTISIYSLLRFLFPFNFRFTISALRTQLFLKRNSPKKIPTSPTAPHTNTHSNIISHKGHWCPLVTKRALFCQEGTCKDCWIYLYRSTRNYWKEKKGIPESIIEADKIIRGGKK